MRRLTLSLLAAVFLVACNRTPTAPTGIPLSASRSDHGSAPSLSWSPVTSTTGPDTYDYGTIDAGQDSTVSFTLTDDGGRSAGTVEISLTGSSAFAITVDNCSGNGVNAEHGCTVTVQYAPTTSGQDDAATLTATGEHASASLALTGASPVAGHIYWTESAGQIGRANMAGLDVNKSFVTGADLPEGVAVDGTYIYWVDEVAGSMGRAKLDGSDVNQSFVTGLGEPQDVTVSPSYIYFTTAYGIERTDLSGSNVTNLHQSGSLFGIAVDNSYVYWTDPVTSTIGRANLDGTGATTLIGGLDRPDGVAVDGTYIFWTEHYDNSIGRAKLDGTDANASFITGANGPVGIADDGTYIYWVNRGNGQIGRAKLDGSDVNQSFISGLTDPDLVAVGSQ